ncbi:MAG: transcriptional regulator [Actinomycetota bacterium]|nr:transcriptional regulator [Actinomycetota bacterium]
MSHETFARHLQVSLRAVAGWHEKPGGRPKPESQRLLDAAFTRADPAVRERFATLCGEPVPTTSNGRESEAPASDQTHAAAEHRLVADPNIGQALTRLDDLAGWEPGTARRQVALRLTQLDRRDLLDRADRRSRIGQPTIAEVLADYYPDAPEGYGRYGVRLPGGAVMTTVLTHRDWLDLECPLIAGNDRLTFTRADTDRAPLLDPTAAVAAAQRLAETLAAGTRFTESTLYRLNDIDIAAGKIGGTLGLSRFTSYALTLDLLEGELNDTLAAGVSPIPGSLPLRDRYLPDVASVLDVSGRLCAGGALALCAFARSATYYRDQADYVLLVQERSGNVINAARRLAVIPKGFHQPMTDYRSDAKIAATLLREMEEELFGREEIDNTLNQQSAADPMHPSRLSEPMRWLLVQNPAALRAECTGFGLNLVSGNYEFASLVVVESDDFWSRYGGQIEANWETSALRQYSSLDSESLAELFTEDTWSNEGLFALAQGLRRLKQIGGDRVRIQDIEWTVS